MAKRIGWLQKAAGRFLARQFGWSGEPQDREVDLALGHPAADVLMTHIANRRWVDCESQFLSRSADERSVLLGYCCQQGAPLELFEEWTSQSKSFVADLFRGTALTYAAWEVRGSGANVEEENAKQFFGLLEKSWDFLLMARVAAPSEPEPMARLIRVAMGLEMETEVIRGLVARCVDTGVRHFGAATYAAEALSARWLGSAEESLDFARAYASQNPHDRAVIACAHVENWTSEGQQETKASQSYFDRPEVQRDLRECWGNEKAFAARTDYFRFQALNYYAFCLFVMQDEEPAREAFDLLGNGVTPKPWIYSIDKPVLAVNMARLQLGLPQI